MKRVILILGLFFSVALMGQSIYKSSIDSGGALAVNGNLEMLYTIGEVNVQEHTVGNIYLSEGFISGEVTAPLSVEGIDVLSGLLIYPNPTASKLYVSGDLSGIKSINIYSLMGKHIMEVQDSFREIDVSLLQSSVYFLKLKTDEGIGILKIVKK